MVFTDAVQEAVLNADSKTLGTTGPHGVNVVPVSSIRIEDGQIWLINYFMEKTEENLRKNPAVSLVCWQGWAGYQIKGTVEYKESGPEFERAKEWIAETLPDRVVKGLIILTPEEIYDVSPPNN